MTARPATIPQFGLLNKVRLERGLPAIPRTEWDARVASGFDTRSASRMIDETKRLVRKASATPAALMPGVYRFEGEIYIVKPTRDRQRLYAKKLVELRDSQGDRLAESGEHVRVEFEYAPGVVGRLTSAMQVSVEEGKALTLRYGKCICCGRGLKVAESVERGIGPVCIKYFSR